MLNNKHSFSFHSSSPQKLLEQISFLNDENGIRQLLSYEHTHTTGLRFLSVMQADLDVQLMLETKYNYLEKLRQAQSEMEYGGHIIYDQITVATNAVLVNAEVIGGCQEKNVPAWTLNENDPNLLTTMHLFGGKMNVPDVYINRINYGNLNNIKTGEYRLISDREIDMYLL